MAYLPIKLPESIPKGPFPILPASHGREGGILALVRSNVYNSSNAPEERNAMASKPDTALLRQLPQVEETLQQPVLQELAGALPHDVLTEAVRNEIGRLRAKILDGGKPAFTVEGIARRAAASAARITHPSLRRAVNASGVIIHTNLGRSVLAPEAIEAVNDVIRGYSTLEYDTDKMARGSRHAHCEALICALTGAEATIAVNNNAAAVMMVLREFASGHEAVVSRGELVEIGGAFRIPDIMELSDARMVEVGTTNKTHPRDYERAITPETVMLLKVHQSNYRMLGFTENVGIAELRRIADAANAKNAMTGGEHVYVYEDQGSGAFERLEVFGEYAEPTIAESLAAGADLVSFSGDKLLGGPQAGIIVGRKDLIDRLKANPMARALRLDTMTLAALEATMRVYLQGGRDGRAARETVPTLRMLTEDAETVRARAEKLFGLMQALLDPAAATLSVVPEVSRAGGGALPMCDIPTFAVKLEPVHSTALDCCRHLEQQCEPPVIARIHDEAILFDARTLLDNELEIVAAKVAAYFA